MTDILPVWTVRTLADGQVIGDREFGQDEESATLFYMWACDLFERGGTSAVEVTVQMSHGENVEAERTFPRA